MTDQTTTEKANLVITAVDVETMNAIIDTMDEYNFVCDLGHEISENIYSDGLSSEFTGNAQDLTNFQERIEHHNFACVCSFESAIS